MKCPSHLTTMSALAAVSLAVANCRRSRQEPSGKAPENPATAGTSQATVLPGFVRIPAGEFIMGESLGWPKEAPPHLVNVSTFFLGKFEVTKLRWDTVRTWGLDNGYTDLPTGGSKAANHPVHSISWYDIVKWCNAWSQMEGLTPCYTFSGETYKTRIRTPVCNWSANGYRLPTEAEWEKAARGGVAGKRFPWGTDTIAQSLANYYGGTGPDRDDLGPSGYNPIGCVGGTDPATSPVGSFAPNGYGLYDMAGNVWERCWDWFGAYVAVPVTDPKGDSLGTFRVCRGGSWSGLACQCRIAERSSDCGPEYSNRSIGFRVARSSGP